MASPSAKSQHKEKTQWLFLTPATMTVTADGDDDKMIGSIGYRGSKRYVRLVATGTTGTNAVVNCHAIKMKGGNMGSASIDSGTAAT
jgi:hypothetical protein